MNQNSSDQNPNQNGVQRSKPIPISVDNFRNRSPSVSSDSSNSPTSSPPLATPKSLPPPRLPTSPTGSPILYFLSQSPSKSSATFPFRGFAPSPVVEDEPVEDIPPHSRARSTSGAGLFQPQPPVAEHHHERGVNVLRRLSLSNVLAKPLMNDISQPRSPQPPPNSAVDSPPINSRLLHGRKTRRSATIAEPTRQRRAPSPMGERILKGHFDGFN